MVANASLRSGEDLPIGALSALYELIKNVVGCLNPQAINVTTNLLLPALGRYKKGQLDFFSESSGMLLNLEGKGCMTFQRCGFIISLL